MLRRGLLIGGLGMSLSLASAGVITQGSVLAQEASTSPETTEISRDERVAEREAERAAQYEAFLAKFAENLGISDPALVETAFKDTLKGLIDDELAAGEISANAAAEMKTRIDEADGAMIFGGFGGGHEGRGMIGMDRHFHGGRGERRGVLIRSEKIRGEGPDGVGGSIVVESGPATDDELEGDVESLPATDETESTPTS